MNQVQRFEQWKADQAKLAAQPIRFKILKDFYEKELKSHYNKDMSYTLRPGNTLLAKHLQDWIDKGLAVLDESVAHAVIQGKG
jgi:hypothetical protein